VGGKDGTLDFRVGALRKCEPEVHHRYQPRSPSDHFNCSVSSLLFAVLDAQGTLCSVFGVRVFIRSALFGLFCAIMLFSQVHSIIYNRSMVESLNLRSMQNRERRVLRRLHSWYECGFVFLRFAFFG
jgi:hypothetical protein